MMKQLIKFWANFWIMFWIWLFRRWDTAMYGRWFGVKILDVAGLEKKIIVMTKEAEENIIRN